MQTFHNDPSIKQKYIERLELHRAHDEIVKGIYWENGKGCAVGCTIHGSDYAAYERELGIPRVIARLEDRIFEGLPNQIAKDFPLRFLNSVPVGVDLSIAFYQFMHWLLVDKEDGVINFVKNSKLIDSIKKVSELFEKKLAGENVTEKEWDDTGNAVYDGAEDAYADSFHSCDADDFAYSYDAASYTAAVELVRMKQADKLIELISKVNI